MASFIKGLFEKRKDAKYGKGHRLGDPAPSPRPSASQETERAPPVQTEAARRAGEAALLRLQQQNQKPSARSEQLQKSSAASSSSDTGAKALEDEMRKAQQLKDHYFGPRKVVEKSAHLERVMFKSAVTGQERYGRDEILDKIEQALLVQYNDEPVLISVTLLFTAHHQNKEKLDKCVETINRFVDNILKNPGEEKYRKLRVENAVFKEKVYSCKYSDLVMRAAGFTARSMPKLSPDGQPSGGETEDCFLYEESDLSRLESLKEALSLGEPILPEMDRGVKAFRPSSAAAATNVSHPELSDDFYNYDVEDLKREKALRDQALEKSGMLRTKAMRERDEKLELKLYRYCLLRIRFPDDLILQAAFKATETVLDLKQFVASCLEPEHMGAFELTGHLMKPLSDSDATLAQSGLAPAALLIFKPTDNHSLPSNGRYIKQSILSESLQNF